MSTLSVRQSDVWELSKQGLSVRAIADATGLKFNTVLNYRHIVARKLGADTGDLPTHRRRRYQHDNELDDETPREARARIAREISEGKRCTHQMRKGPCSLLLPCADHGGVVGHVDQQLCAGAE